MENLDTLRQMGLFDSRVPRYTSYPTAPVFSPDVGADFQEEALRGLDPAEPVSVYVHIPFCERLCWFCACRTQGTSTLKPVEAYIGTLEQELALIKPMLPEGLRMGRLHWGGGTPTILPPALIHRLAQAIRAVFPPTDDCEFSVEVDPTMVDADKIAALAEEGMNRASMGIQDFDPLVQQAIGRAQPFEVTRDCVEMLRAAGITSLNADLVYGLPHQTPARMADTLEKVMSLAPDRIALFGYAHVPWVAKRQKLIPEDVLPDDPERYALSRQAAARFAEGGLDPIGIDHFAKHGDEMERAQRDGRLRRNFQGYTADHCDTLIGLGASSISRYAVGYVQNAAATPAYIQRIEAGALPGARGYVMTRDDLMRADLIEDLMCNFCIDRDALAARYGDLAQTLAPDFDAVKAHFGDLISLDDHLLTLRPPGRALTRIVASHFDAHAPADVQYSRAS